MKDAALDGGYIRVIEPPTLPAPYYEFCYGIQATGGENMSNYTGIRIKQPQPKRFPSGAMLPVTFPSRL